MISRYLISKCLLDFGDKQAFFIGSFRNHHGSRNLSGRFTMRRVLTRYDKGCLGTWDYFALVVANRYLL